MELLDRVKNKDREAFVEFMRSYGPKLYTRMLDKLGDRKLADAAFKETMIGFYKSLTENEGEDAISSLLTGYADEVSGRLQFDYLEDIIEKTADCAEKSDIEKFALPVPENKKVVENIIPHDICCDEAVDNMKESRKWLFAVALLSVCSLIVVWIIIGLLCSMGTIPDINLGYEWFNNNIAEWF